MSPNAPPPPAGSRGRADDGLLGSGTEAQATDDRRRPEAPPPILCKIADRALATGAVQAADLDGMPVLVVPDAVMEAGRRRGLPSPATSKMQRPDGGTVHIFKMPEMER